jgi:putative endopeptidase
MGINLYFSCMPRLIRKKLLDMVAYLNQGGLRMPNREYYLNDDERSKGIQKKYLEFIAGTFSLMGDSDEVAQRKAETIYSIEREMATYFHESARSKGPLQNVSQNDHSRIDRSCT